VHAIILTPDAHLILGRSDLAAQSWFIELYHLEPSPVDAEENLNSAADLRETLSEFLSRNGLWPLTTVTQSEIDAALLAEVFAPRRPRAKTPGS